jgi:hypothetical protein
MTLSYAIEHLRETALDAGMERWFEDEGEASKHAVLPRCVVVAVAEDLEWQGSVVSRRRLDKNTATRRRLYGRSVGVVCRLEAKDLAQLESIYESWLTGIGQGVHDNQENWIGVRAVGASWVLGRSVSDRTASVAVRFEILGGIYSNQELERFVDVGIQPVELLSAEEES